VRSNLATNDDDDDADDDDTIRRRSFDFWNEATNDMQEMRRNSERSGDVNKTSASPTVMMTTIPNDNDGFDRDLTGCEEKGGMKRNFRRDKNTDHYDEDFASAKRKRYHSWSEYICRFQPKPWGWQWRSWYFYRAARQSRKTYNYRYPELHVGDECYNYWNDHALARRGLLLHS